MLLEALPALPADHDQTRARLVRRGFELSVFALVVVSFEAAVSVSAGVRAVPSDILPTMFARSVGLTPVIFANPAALASSL